MFHPIFYIFAIINNIVFRFIWLPIFLITTFTSKYLGTWGFVISTVIACLEVFRRFVWNIIRVENEHLNNVGEYRLTKEIPLPCKIFYIYKNS
jgi:hypothetical protein